MKKISYILFLILIGAGMVRSADMATPDTVKSAPGITIETSVDKSEILIGDLISYRLAVIHDSNIVLTPPPIGANLGAFDVKDYQSDVATTLKDGRIKTESRFQLTTFTTGDYIIPPIPVQFKLPDGTVKYLISEPTPIKVKSLLANATDSADIRDIKSPIEFKSDNKIYYYLAGALIVLLAAAGYIYWRIRKKRRGIVEPIDLRKPWEIAFEELALLKEKHYVEDSQFKLFYIELIDIVRAYWGRIYKIPALDMTTEEYLDRIRDEDISEELYNRMKRLLNFADLVKFAKFIPEAGNAASDFDETTSMVEYIRQDTITKDMAASVAAPKNIESSGVANV
jgi:hypothetical protein